MGRERVALGAPHLKYATAVPLPVVAASALARPTPPLVPREPVQRLPLETPMAFVRSPRDALSTSSTVGLPLRYCLYTLFALDRVVLPFLAASRCLAHLRPR